MTRHRAFIGYSHEDEDDFNLVHKAHKNCGLDPMSSVDLVPGEGPTRLGGGRSVLREWVASSSYDGALRLWLWDGAPLTKG